jgi:sec-independent protein translocase protein TatC
MTEELEPGTMPLIEHLIELRRRLIYSMVAILAGWCVCYYFGKELLDFLIKPLGQELAPGQHMIYTALTEAFITRVKIAFWAACFLAFPVVATQVWMFVAPGLYKNEKAAFLPYLILTPVLFFIGGSLVYYVIFPNVFHFFLSFQSAGADGSVPIDAAPKISEYLSLSLRMIFAFGLAFELPVALTLMARVGIISSDFLRKNRRYAILANTVVAAFAAPPDALSMVALALPLCVLYEISIWSCRFIERGRARRQAEDDLRNE